MDKNFFENHLKRRAEKFLNLSEFAFSQKDWEMSAFLSEQAAQLFLKSYLFDHIGEYPKTHSLRFLLRYVGRIKKKEDEVEKFIKENSTVLSALELAYIGARYLPHEYEESEVSEFLRFIKRMREFVFK